ncbi:hypothetical protein M2139_001630 [Enterococcus sp. PF1-24]|uniref:phage tail tip lysozyme n=1 Tax=unclassified Enterococcus TaxID=2608891 RepID=UPI002473F5B2|nr:MULTISPECIES: phage tail tip lysozyme [unclassified Enterococcus]MDH6364643.1 hypothetical protein [Enterococcus sp. PFB1-1]MDH6401744.1 hypothetical protein [Enterococcus sp. PF1-24]
MANTNTAINWFTSRRGNVFYSQGNRLGPGSYDCSSAVYFALVAGGFLKEGTMGNTDSLFNDLEAAGWKRLNLPAATPKRGDVFIWGVKGASSGNAGHTGMFIDSQQIIECTSGSVNGIHTTNYQSARSYAGNPPEAIYRNPNGSGGTPDLNTPEEKRAWAFAQVMTELGYNTAAIAGMLGNVELEVGTSLNPDTEQIGGPAYGIVQWDGSAYPLAGGATHNGRAYVQQLFATSGVQGDYKAMEPQARLVDWCNHNGQWIGKVEPSTVAGFKQVGDAATAAKAFLYNFERPSGVKEAERVSAANKWFDWLQNTSFEGEGFEEETKVGELEILGIKNQKIFAEGWHFSSTLPRHILVFYDAETSEELGRVETEAVYRPDLAEKRSDTMGIDMSGFSVEFSVPNHTGVYLESIRTDGELEDVLNFNQMIFYEQAFDVEDDTFAEGNEKFFFEIIEGNKVIKRGTILLNDTLDWQVELMAEPQTDIELPIEYWQYLNGRPEMKIYVNQKVFHGVVLDPVLDKQEETVSFTLAHVIHEWTYEEVKTNLTAKNRTINDIFSTLNFRYSNQWNIDYLNNSGMSVIDYVYSRQNKQESLTKTCELTPDLFWRVGFNCGRRIEISQFGEEKPYTISVKAPSQQNIQILEEPIVTINSSNVKNVLTVYGEKSDSGMSSMSLRDVYLEKEGATIPGFPVVILRDGINTERQYPYISYNKLAPNNAYEYAVLDEESIALEGAIKIEGSVAFNDLAPFGKKDEEVTDEDRCKAAKIAYDAAVKRLKSFRRDISLELHVSRLPHDVNVGDKLRLLYDNQIFKVMECSSYMQKILTYDDWFYLTGITHHIHANGMETATIILNKYLKIERWSNND